MSWLWFAVFLSLPLIQDNLPSAHDPYFGPVRTLSLVSKDGRQLIDDFNRTSDRPRLVAVLSPTADDSLRLALSLRRFLEDHSEDGMRIEVVWSCTAPSDSRRRALAATSILSDPRSEHFFDPEAVFPRILGLRFSDDGTPWTGLAYYPAETVWGDLPPQPVWRAGDPSRLEALADLIAADSSQ